MCGTVEKKTPFSFTIKGYVLNSREKNPLSVLQSKVMCGTVEILLNYMLCMKQSRNKKTCQFKSKVMYGTVENKTCQF